jgi:N-acetylneuraminic acid mutarotase
MKLRKLRFTLRRYVGVTLGLLLVLMGLTRSLNAQDTKVVSDSLSAQSLSTSTELSWSTVAPSPIARIESLCAPVDGKLYLFGGYIDKSFNPTKRSDVYDPATNTWKRIADLPKALTHVGTAANGKDIYFAGGYIGKKPGASTYGGQIFATTDVWKYNVDTNSWSSMPPLPQARGSGELAILNGELHFFGGADIKRVDKGEHWVLSLDDLKKGWSSAAPLPNPRSHMGDTVIGGKIYAIGGQHDVDKELVTQNSVHMWDPAQPNKWTAVASLPSARSHISASTFVMNNRIVVAGGELDHSKAMRDVTAYDPMTNSWTELTPLPAPRLSGVARNIGNRIYFTTGGGGTPSTNFTSTTFKGTPVIVSSSPQAS